MRISDWSSDVCSSDLGASPSATPATRSSRRSSPAASGALSGLVDGEPGSGLVVPAPHRTGGVAHHEGARGDVTGDHGAGAHEGVLPDGDAHQHDAADAEEIGRASWRERVCPYV